MTISYTPPHTVHTVSASQLQALSEKETAEGVTSCEEGRVRKRLAQFMATLSHRNNPEALLHRQACSFPGKRIL